MGLNRRGFLAALVVAIFGKPIIKTALKAASDAYSYSIKFVTKQGHEIPPFTNPGLFGLRYYQISGNAGMFMGIPRLLSKPTTASEFQDEIVRDWQRLIDEELKRMRLPGSFRRYIEAERALNA